MENLHKRIKTLRISHNLTEKQVAVQLGISQQAYSGYECGKHELPSRHLATLARLYNVSADFILGIEPTHAGSFDLQVEYVNNIPLKNVIISSMKLNTSKRWTLVRFLDFLLASTS